MSDRLADRLISAGFLRGEELLREMPDRFGRYRVEGLIGEGAFGTVYRAFDPQLQRPVAVKVLRAATPRHLERFRQEMRLLARLRHPNIVTVFDAGTDNDAVWFVMEYVGEASLARYRWWPDAEPSVDGDRDVPTAGAERLTTDELVEVLVQVCDACEAAHGAGIIHRDLKPANVLVERNAAPRDGLPLQGRLRAAVADFGVARLLDRERTTSGVVVGTPQYMAPEQLDPKGKVGPWTDVYAIGVILYQLLAGRLPFDASELETLAGQIRRGVHQPPSAFRAGVPPALDLVALRAMNPDWRSRFGSAAALREALRDAVARPSVPRLAPSRPAPVGPPATRRQRRAVVLGACAISVAAAFIWLSVRPYGTGGGDPRPASPADRGGVVAEVLDAIIAVQRWETEFYKVRGAAETGRPDAPADFGGDGELRIVRIDPPPYEVLEQAARRLERALEVDHVALELRHRAAHALGRARLWMGENHAAIAAFERALQFTPETCAECLWDRAVARWEQFVLTRSLDGPGLEPLRRRCLADWRAVAFSNAADGSEVPDRPSGRVAVASEIAKALAANSKPAFAAAASRLAAIELADVAERERLRGDLCLCADQWSEAIIAYAEALRHRRWFVPCYAGRSIARYRAGGRAAVQTAIADAVAAIQFNPRSESPYAVFRLLVRHLVARLPDEFRRGADLGLQGSDVRFAADVRRVLADAARALPERLDVRMAGAAAALLHALALWEAHADPAPHVRRALEILAPDGEPVADTFEARMLAGVAMLTAARLGISTFVQAPAEAARRQFESAVALQPEAAEAHLWLGFAHLRVGDRDAARRAWQRAVALDARLAEQLGPRWQRLQHDAQRP